MNIAMRTVPLNNEGHYLKFDVSRFVIRMAYYYPEYNAAGKQVGEGRVSIKRKTLAEALQVVLGETDAPFEPLTVEAYIRDTGGRELP